MNLDLGDTRLIMAEAARRGVLRNQLAYILATTKWETNHTMKPVEEAYYLQAKYKWTDAKMDAWRAKNLRYYPHHGRGYVQCTWLSNYIRAGKELDVDLTTNPDRVMEPKIAAQILVVGSMQGWFTGKKIPDYITLQRSDFVSARRVINGTDKAAEIAALAKQYDAALKAAGWGIDAPSTPPVPVPAQSIWAALVAAVLGLLGKK